MNFPIIRGEDRTVSMKDLNPHLFHWSRSRDRITLQDIVPDFGYIERRSDDSRGGMAGRTNFVDTDVIFLFDQDGRFMLPEGSRGHSNFGATLASRSMLVLNGMRSFSVSVYHFEVTREYTLTEQ